MSDSRKQTSRIILAASLAIFFVSATGVIYSRFSDSGVEKIISSPISAVMEKKTGAPLPTPDESVPAPETQTPPPSAEAPADRPEVTPVDVAAVLEENADARTIVQTASAFYDDYLRLLANAEDQLPGNAPSLAVQDESIESRLVNFLYERPDVHMGFAEKIDRMVTLAMQDSEKSELRSDPIVMATPSPSEMRYDAPTIVADKAYSIVHAVWNAEKSHPICLSLIKSGDLWQIEDIVDMGMPGSTAECGGKKAGSFQQALPGPVNGKQPAPPAIEPIMISPPPPASPPPGEPEATIPGPLPEQTSTLEAPENKPEPITPTVIPTPEKTAGPPQHVPPPALPPNPTAPGGPPRPLRPARPPAPGVIVNIPAIPSPELPPAPTAPAPARPPARSAP